MGLSYGCHSDVRTRAFIVSVSVLHSHSLYYQKKLKTFSDFDDCGFESIAFLCAIKVLTRRILNQLETLFRKFLIFLTQNTFWFTITVR